jgi:hypothetical protein
MRRHRGEEKDEEEEEEVEANILLLHFVQVQKTQAEIHINSNRCMLSKHLQVLEHLVSKTCVTNGRRLPSNNGNKINN